MTITVAKLVVIVIKGFNSAVRGVNLWFIALKVILEKLNYLFVNLESGYETTSCIDYRPAGTCSANLAKHSFVILFVAFLFIIINLC